MSPEDPDSITEKNLSVKVPVPDSWDEVLAAFANELYRLGRSEQTAITYTSALRTFALFYRDHLKKPGPHVALIQETEIHAFISYLHDNRHLSTTSVNRYTTSLRAFSRFLLGKGWRRHMIAHSLKASRIYPVEPQPQLCPAEVTRLVKAVDLNIRNGPRDLAILQLFLQCGLRVSELVKLSCDDVNLHKSAAKLRVRGEQGRQERTIPLNATARKAIENYFESRGSLVGGDPLFLSERRRRIGISTVQYLIKKFLCAIDREDLSTNDLRHHFALRFYAQSGKLTATQKVLGHSDLRTTARYARMLDEDIQQAIDAFDD
jgi:site-specific recombinase XerD